MTIYIIHVIDKAMVKLSCFFLEIIWKKYDCIFASINILHSDSHRKTIIIAFRVILFTHK